MGLLFLLILVALGFLVMVRIIPLSRIGKYLCFAVLLMIFGPIILSVARQEGTSFFTGPHPWWVYGLLFLAILIGLRIFLNFLIPRGRRD